MFRLLQFDIILLSWRFFIKLALSLKSLRIVFVCEMKIAVQVTAGHDFVPFLGSLGKAFSAIPCFGQSYRSQVLV